MKNLEQIRAASALNYAHSATEKTGSDGGDIIRKLPALIMSNGLLAAGAFAYSKKPESGWYHCFNELTKHLSHREIGIIPNKCQNLKDFLEYLSKDGDSTILKQSTDEALAWFSYVKRFVKKDSNKGEYDDSDES